MSKFIINVEAGKTVCDSRCPMFKEEPHCGGGVYIGDRYYIGCTFYDLATLEVDEVKEERK